MTLRASRVGKRFGEAAQRQGVFFSDPDKIILLLPVLMRLLETLHDSFYSFFSLLVSNPSSYLPSSTIVYILSAILFFKHRVFEKIK